MITLTDWRLAGQTLKGAVLEHPRFPNGHQVTTSPVCRVEKGVQGHQAVTSNGSRYVLGGVVDLLEFERAGIPIHLVD